MDQSKVIQELSANKLPDVLPYDMREDVKRAIDDFRNIGTQAYCVVLYNMGLMSVTKNGIQLASVLCVPVDLSKKTVNFPKNKMKFDDPKMYVAAVCYNNGNTADILLLPASMFAVRPLSFFKRLFNKALVTEEQGELVLNTKRVNSPSLKKYTFNAMLGQLQGAN